MVAAAGISALGSLGGSMLGASSSGKNVSRANAFTREQMENRHKWEVGDLRSAGLNPVLSAQGTPSMGASPVADAFNPSEAISSGLQAARLNAEIKLMKSQARKNNADSEGREDLNNVTDITGNLARAAAQPVNDAINSAKSVYNTGKSFTQKSMKKSHAFGVKTRKKFNKLKSIFKRK